MSDRELVVYCDRCPSTVFTDTGLDILDCLTRLESENAKLRAVLAAARKYLRFSLLGDRLELEDAVHAADQSSAEPRCVTCNDTGEVGAVSGYVCSCAVGEKDGGGS